MLRRSDPCRRAGGALLALVALVLLACGGALAAPLGPSLGTFTQYHVPTAGGVPVGIAVGSDGALWFTELQGNKIGRITANGSITEFPISTPVSEPFGIAAGPDGNMWFTQSNMIGRITPNGSITEFPIPTSEDHPQEIAAGPDGAMWFTEQGRIPAVARISVTGSITTFPIPTPAAHAGGIAAGPDGDMWFLEAAKVGRITPTGSITEFPIPEPAGAETVGIAPGPDHAMWFTESGRNKVGRISATGSITTFRIPAAHSGPASIVAGPDHAMWFGEGVANNIALVGTGPPVVKINGAKINIARGAAAFRFHAVGFASGFRCALVTQRKHHAQPKPRFSSCTSPKTYTHLAAGEYVFEVRALNPVTSGTPVQKSFTIKAVR